MDRISDWITTGERDLARIPYISSFAKAAAGGSDDDEDDSDDDDSDDDDDEDEDPDADKSDDELRAELKAVRKSLETANGQSAKRRGRERELKAALEEARKPKPKKDADDDKPDVDTIRAEAKREGEKTGVDRAKRSEAKAALLAAGVSPERVARVVNLVDLDDLDLDDDGLDGIDEAIDKLKRDVPEFFARARKRRESVLTGGGDRNGDAPKRKLSPSDQQAAILTGRK